MNKCPKCGADNSIESTVCSSCQAQLANTDSKPYQPAVAGPGAVNAYSPTVAGPGSVDSMIRSGGPLAGDDMSDGPVSVVGQPLNSQQNGQQGSSLGSLGGPQSDPYGVVKAPPRVRYQQKQDLAPVKPRFWAGIFGSLITLAILIGGGWFVYYRFVALPQGPMEASRAFVTAVNNNDLQSLKDIVTQRSGEYLVNMSLVARRSGRSLTVDFFHGQGVGMEEGREYKLALQSIDQTTAKVLVKPGPGAIAGFRYEDLPPKMKDGVPVPVVKEGDTWKVDLEQFVRDFEGAKASPNASLR